MAPTKIRQYVERSIAMELNALNINAGRLFLDLFLNFFILPILSFRQDEFACKNDRQCIPITKVCDGVRHCRDASDENSEICIQREYGKLFLFKNFIKYKIRLRLI